MISDNAYQATHWEVSLLSEIDFTPETECFSTRTEAEEAIQDNLKLIDLKIDQLMAQHDKISSQAIRKVVD